MCHGLARFSSFKGYRVSAEKCRFYTRAFSIQMGEKMHRHSIDAESKNSIAVVLQVTRPTRRRIMSSWLDHLLFRIRAPLLHPHEWNYSPPDCSGEDAIDMRGAAAETFCRIVLVSSVSWRESINSPQMVQWLTRDNAARRSLKAKTKCLGCWCWHWWDILNIQKEEIMECGGERMRPWRRTKDVGFWSL